MPQVIHSHSKRATIVKRVLPAAVILAVAICVVLILTHHTKPSGPSAAQVEVQAQAFDNAHDYASEQSLLQNYIADHPSNADEYPLLIQLGTLAVDNHDYTSALKWYKQSEIVTGKTQITDAVGAAISDASLGNKTDAISYYKQAIALSNTSIPDNNVSSYQDDIKALGGTP